MTLVDGERRGVPEKVAIAWSAVRENLRLEVGARNFDHWLARVRLGDYCAVDRTVELVLPSSFLASWVASNFGDRLNLAWRAMLPEVLTVRVVAQDEDDVTYAALPKPAELPAAPDAPLCRFDPRQTFDQFVTGDANRMACNAARAVGGGGPLNFNPLYLHGPTGHGKTHLLHAIGHAFVERAPAARAITMSAERFMIEFVSAIRNKDTMAFKERLRSVDLLLVDDFQFIAGKGPTQEEFLYTIDELLRAGKRIVIAADRGPHELDGVEGRILSRLTQGLVVDIKPADYPLRRAIVEARATVIPHVIPAPVLDMLAARIASNIRELEGGLNRLMAYASLNNRPIDEQFAEEVLGDMFRAGRRRVTIDEIQRRVSDHFKIRQAEMVSARRARAVARPRQIAMYLAKQLTPRSLPEIGRRFGGRDHTTVIHAVKQVEKLRAADGELDADVRLLMRVLEG